MGKYWINTEQIPNQSNWEPENIRYEDKAEAVAMAVEKVKETGHQVCVLTFPLEPGQIDEINRIFIKPENLI